MTQLNQLGAALPGDVTLINNTGSTIPEGYAVMLVTATPGEMSLPGAAADFFGVTMESVPTGKPGRVRPFGIVVGTATAAVITCGDKLMCDAAGKVLTLAGGATTQCGRAMSTTGGADGERVQFKIENANNA